MTSVWLDVSVIKAGAGSRLTSIIRAGRNSFPCLDKRGLIEERAAITQKAGAQPLWDGYREVYGATDKRGLKNFSRSSNNVRTGEAAGTFYAWLVAEIKPNVIVEIGTAFGVSGMYWLSGLESNKHGKLLTFDPNEVWRSLAIENLASIGSRFESILGTFEDNIGSTLRPEDTIDIAFIDAIHTSKFVASQFSIIRSRAAAGSIVVFDDIRFSKDMYQCWSEIANGPFCLSSLELGKRVGIIELSL